MPRLSVGPAASRWVKIGLVGVALVLVHTWPLAARLDRIGRVDSFDGQYGLWQAAWVARAIVTDPAGVYHANVFHPHRYTLAFSEPTLLAGLLGLPAFVATESPYATHNLAVLAFFLLAFLCAAGLGRHLTGRTIPALALGTAYAFSPYMFARTAQLPMMGIFGLPLSLLAMHRLVEAPSFRAAAGVAGALLLQALACGYYTVFALLLMACGIVYFGLHRARRSNPAYWFWVGAAAMMSVACLLPLFWPHIRLAQSQGFSRPVDEAFRFAADWRAWFASSAWAHRWMLSILEQWNEVLFPGFVPLAFGGAGAVLGLRGRLQGPDRPISVRMVTGFYVLVLALSVWLAFGPAGGLYSFLYQTLPVFSFIRAAGRFGLVTTLAVAVLMALALAHLERRSSRGRVAVALVVVALAAELFSGPRPMSPALPVSPVYHQLAAQPWGPVAELPMFAGRLELNAPYVLLSTTHWKPLVNGYGAFWPADLQELAGQVGRFPSAEALEVLRRWGVRYVVVHPLLYERYGLAAAADVIARTDALHPGLSLIAADQHVRLYRVRDSVDKR